MSRPTLVEQIRRGTGASAVELGPRLQSLWGGYGELRRVQLTGSLAKHAVLKSVVPPAERELSRDAGKLRSHRRKLKSYQVELAFYRGFAGRCDAHCRVPVLLHGEVSDDRFSFVLEDLDEAGFSGRRTRCAEPEIAACLSWLAAFHARFLGVAPEKLWKVGTYWHLATRPDELAVLPGELRLAAPRIDERLNAARFRTLVHGDAKLENFCFPDAGTGVAAVDFQYVGGGVGVKDVAYFLSSCFETHECAARVPQALDVYFAALSLELARLKALSADEAALLEREWRTLFAWAWADFHRFLLGWAPAYAESDSYSQGVLQQVLAELR